MLDLSPAKLLVIVIVAVILLGPDKLPQVARQVGATVRKLRDLQRRVDQEVRQNIPDLPSTGDIARYARSPMTLINQWADDLVEDPSAEVVQDTADWPADPAAGEVAATTEGAAPAAGPADPAAGPAEGAGPANPVPDDPGMN